jgi:sugar phosphate isomerase/epimerase
MTRLGEQAIQRAFNMNRRDFLMMATATALAPSLADAASARRINLGFSLYGMKSLPLDKALETCAEIGYAHVELALNEGYPTAPAVFSAAAREATAARLQRLELELPCLMLNISLTANDNDHAQALALIEQAGTLARELVPNNPPILETVLGGNPDAWEQQKAGMVQRLRDWGIAAEKAKTAIAIKAHVGSAVNSPERLLWLLDQVASPAIHVAYDYSHFELQGIGMEESMRALLPRTRFIHVKDSEGDARKFQFLLPGEGRTDYIQYFSLLKKLGYQGSVCVEVSGHVFSKPGYDAVIAATTCHAALSAALARAG